jgi:uncharacterized protein YndB with AHSA1/START domain
MTTQTEKLTLRLERLIAAPPERVFAAWTQPELLNQWSSPPGISIDGGDLDLRVGGHWRVAMRGVDGSTREAFGTYREIVSPKRLVYTHAWRLGGPGGGTTPETVLTVEFRPEGNGTRVVLTQAGFESAESRDGHRIGWSSSIDNLEKLFVEKRA